MKKILIPPVDNRDKDELLREAKKLIKLSGRASTSHFQRKLNIGYARAARLLDILEDEGVISPYRGSSPRKVLIRKKDL